MGDPAKPGLTPDKQASETKTESSSSSGGSSGSNSSQSSVRKK